MMYRVKLIASLGFWLVFGMVASAQNLPGWTLVWSDEFTQADGSSPNSAKWAFDIGNGSGGWGNNEWQYYTSRTNNVRIENNQLVIEARQENYMGSSYTSARLKTQGKASWTYGRVEARLKLPRGQGIWPAFWMLGTNFTSAGWPACGEIDIMEHIGREPKLVYGTIHGPGYAGGDSIGGSYALPGGADFADDFHVHAMEWTTNRIRWFVDGVQYFNVTPASLGGDIWVFTQPEFILLNLAVGGNWPGYPNATTVFPQQFIVDYVRVYAASNPPPTTSGVLINGDFETGALAPWVGKDFCCANPQGGNITDTNGLVWDPTLNANNTQNIRNPAFGEFSCKLYGNFNGGPNTPGFYQEVAVVPGSLWNASIKARTQNTDHIRDSNQAVVEVSFLDSLNTVLAKFAAPVFNTNSPINTWIDLKVNQRTFPSPATTNLLWAPPNTTKARFEVSFSQTLYEWGSIYFDDALLQEVSRPVLAAEFDPGGNIEIAFQTQPGVNYQIVFKNSLTAGSWNPVEIIAGDGTAKSVSYPVTEPLRFYSVRLL